MISSSFTKKYTNKTARSKTSSNFYRKNKKITENQLAIEDTKKLYQKYYENPNPLLLSQLKTETLNIFLDNYNYNDITVITKILNKYFYFRFLTLAPYDPQKKSPKSKRNNNKSPLTEGEKVKMEKEKRDQEIENMHMINKITLGIGKHLTLSENLIALSLVNLKIDEKFAQNLSKGIIGNKSIHALSINNCPMNIEVYEILLKGLLNHEKIEYLDLQNNNLGDKYGNMIGRIIARQTYRRDQEIWLYGLRNEFPETNDYTLGLISINLNGNKLSSYTADCITTSLASDQYVRSIVLTNNNFDKNSCKKFIYMLRRNLTLLNIDLRNNPGYDDNIKTRLVMKMSKNIRNLYIQFKNKVYTEKEFQNYKKFIDTSFFDLDIPEEIVEFYNNNLQKISENSLTNNHFNNKINKNNINNNININNIKNIHEEEEKEYSKSLPLKSKNKFIKNSPKNNKTYSEKENKKLLEENLLLKKKILELKAEKVQNKLKKNINIPNSFNMDSLNKNYKIVDELFDKLNEIMTTMGNNDDNNNKVNVENKNIKINENIINEDKLDIKINNIKNKDKDKDNNIKQEKEIKEKEKEKNIIEKKDKEKEKEKDLDSKKNNIKNEKEIIEDNKKKNIEKNNNINIKDKNEENEKDNENENEELDLEDLNEEEYRMLYYRHLYEQLKKEYDKKGIKFDFEDYMEMLQQAAEQEEEGENEEI